QFFCGWKINKTIAQRRMSNQRKALHSRALKLLISQVLAMSFAFFSIVNPIIIIYFTDDYKRFIRGHNSSSCMFFCFGTWTISLFLNITLVYIVYKRVGRIGFYRSVGCFFLLIRDEQHLADTLRTPLWYSGPGMLCFFSVAPWTNYAVQIQVNFQIFFLVFTTCLLCVTCSFVYRYGMLCSPFIVSLFEVPRRAVATLLFLAV
ncbi:hypothetical protein PFISCL1PPCAC_13810, partial [Pristionchus fissidentatus]